MTLASKIASGCRDMELHLAGDEEAEACAES